MKVVKQKDFENNFDEYLDLVEKEKERITIILDNGKSVYLEPVFVDEAN